MKKNKIAVYTCIYGNYDDLIMPKHESINEKADFFCFTDNPNLTSSFYEIIVTDFDFGDSVRNSRYPKINSHLFFENYELSIYIDANQRLIAQDFEELLARLNGNDIARYYHNERQCTYEEAEVIIRANLDRKSIVKQQLAKYRLEKFPKNYGLANNSLILRRYGVKTIEFNEIWWKVYNEFSRRDQLSGEYARWKSGVTHTFIAELWNYSAFNYRIDHKVAR